MWIVSSFSWPSRITLTETFVPTGVWATRFRNSLTVCTSLPSNSTITSPRCKPAFRAGPCSFTSLTRAPFCSLTLKALARSGVISWMATPSHPRTTFPILMRLSAMGLASETGTANPMPSLPPVREKIAVLMPMSSPLRFTSAPPEFPGLMDASVWMKSS